MKKRLLLYILSLMILCLTGCSEDISDFNILEYGQNRIEESIEESVKKNREKSQKAVDEMKQNASGAVEEVTNNVKTGITNKFIDFFKTPFNSFGCNHKIPSIFNAETNTITCECGKKEINSDFVDFVKATYEFSSDPTLASQFSELSSSLSNLCGSCNEVVKGKVAKAQKNKAVQKEIEKLNDCIELLNIASTIFEYTSTAIDIYDNANQIKEDGLSKETLQLQVSIYQDLTSTIPVMGDYFTELLESVGNLLDVLFTGHDTKLLQDHIANHVLLVVLGEIEDNNIKNYDKIGSKNTWNQGPTLKALSDAKSDGRLSDEDIIILTPYITYRFEQEFAEYTNLDLIKDTEESNTH